MDIEIKELSNGILYRPVDDDTENHELAGASQEIHPLGSGEKFKEIGQDPDSQKGQKSQRIPFGGFRTEQGFQPSRIEAFEE
jgi:hypothetical protein